MSEELKHGARNLSRFDAMTAEALEELLRLDSEAPKGKESDVETILEIMEVLAKRKKENSSGITAQQSWESFQQYYLPEIEERLDDDWEDTNTVKPLRRRPRRWLLVAAVTALLVSIPLAVGALNWDKTRDVLATWKDGIFSFVGNDKMQTTEPAVTANLPYTSLQDALASTGNRTDIVPTWVPEGYTLADITIDESPQKQVYTAIYDKGDAMLKISVRSFLSSNPSKIEINDQLVEFYPSAGTDYYIFRNNNMLSAIWLRDSYECVIIGDLTLKEMKTMIDSIRKG